MSDINYKSQYRQCTTMQLRYTWYSVISKVSKCVGNQLSNTPSIFINRNSMLLHVVLPKHHAIEQFHLKSRKSRVQSRKIWLGKIVFLTLGYLDWDQVKNHTYVLLSLGSPNVENPLLSTSCLEDKMQMPQPGEELAWLGESGAVVQPPQSRKHPPTPVPPSPKLHCSYRCRS